MTFQTINTRVRERLWRAVWTTLATASILIVTSVADIVDDVDDIGSQHGVFAFGLVQVVKTPAGIYACGQATLKVTEPVSSPHDPVQGLCDFELVVGGPVLLVLVRGGLV